VQSDTADHVFADYYDYVCRLPSQQILVASFLVVSTSIILKDPKLPKGFYCFLVIFDCGAHRKNEFRQNG